MGQVALPCCLAAKQNPQYNQDQRCIQKPRAYTNTASTTIRNVRVVDASNNNNASHLSQVEQQRKDQIIEEKKEVRREEIYRKEERSPTLHETPKMMKVESWKKVEVNKYTLIRLLGQGGFGKVFLGCLTKTASSKDVQLYALKRLKKSEVKEKRVMENINLEKQILRESKSDFITRLHSTFRDSEHYYIVMEWAERGDLHSFLDEGSERKQEFMANLEDSIRFIMGCVILGLEELHSKSIVYSDLKPSNILLFADGYAKLADFGVSVMLKKNTPCTFKSGTKRYFAPEMVMGTECKRYVDLWAMGVLAYQLSNFCYPFRVEDIENSKKFHIIVDESSKKREWRNPWISQELKNFINKLLRLEPRLRLGVSGSQGLKNHAFFKKANFDWQALENKTMKSPLLKILSKKDPNDSMIKPRLVQNSMERRGRSNIETIQNWSTFGEDE